MFILGPYTKYLMHSFKHQDKQQLMDQYGAKANVSLVTEKSTANDDQNEHRSDDDNDDSSILGDAGSSSSTTNSSSSVSARAKYTCAVCGTTSASKNNDSTTWYHCPDNIGEDKKLDKRRKGQKKAMCEDCGIRWRHCK